MQRACEDDRYAPPSSQPSERVESGPRPRPWLAAALSLLAPGAGHCYARATARALLLPPSIWLALLAAHYVVREQPLLAWLVLAVPIAVAVDAFRTAQRSARRRASAFAVAGFTLLFQVPTGIIAAGGEAYLSDGLYVPAGSMTPALLPGDSVIADKLAYVLGDPQRGDIAVFRFPDDPRLLYLKRVIGLPGDVVELEGLDLRINGELVPRTPAGAYEAEPELLALREEIAPGRSYVVLYDERAQLPRRAVRFEVPPDAYFVLGDHRDRSRDSRFWREPFVPRIDMLGRIVRRHWSTDPETGRSRLDRIGAIEE